MLNISPSSYKFNLEKLNIILIIINNLTIIYNYHIYIYIKKSITPTNCKIHFVWNCAEMIFINYGFVPYSYWTDQIDFSLISLLKRPLQWTRALTLYYFYHEIINGHCTVLLHKFFVSLKHLFLSGILPSFDSLCSLILSFSLRPFLLLSLFSRSHIAAIPLCAVNTCRASSVRFTFVENKQYPACARHRPCVIDTVYAIGLQREMTRRKIELIFL